jgi:hypothetical protein
MGVPQSQGWAWPLAASGLAPPLPLPAIPVGKRRGRPRAPGLLARKAPSTSERAKLRAACGARLAVGCGTELSLVFKDLASVAAVRI